MKNILGIILISASLGATSAQADLILHGDKGNGGDPYNFYAKPYPQQEKLEKAVDIAIEKLEGSGLPADLLADSVYEFRALEGNGRFAYLDVIIVGQPNMQTGGFQASGAMTGDQKGDFVYLSSKTLGYTETELARLLTHEVFHHTLRKTLSHDEVFVEKLAQSVVYSTSGSEVLKALDKGVYLTKNHVPMRSMLRFWIEDLSGDKPCEGLEKKSLNACLDKLMKKYQFPENGADLSINALRGRFFAIAGRELDVKRDVVSITANRVMTDLFKTLGNPLDGKNSPHKYGHGYCQVPTSWLDGCPKGKSAKVKDLLK